MAESLRVENIEFARMRNTMPYTLVFHAGTLDELRLAPAPHLRLRTDFALREPTPVRIVPHASTLGCDYDRPTTETRYADECAARTLVPSAVYEEMSRGRVWMVEAHEARHLLGLANIAALSNNTVFTPQGNLVSYCDASGAKQCDLYVSWLERHQEST